MGTVIFSKHTLNPRALLKNTTTFQFSSRPDIPSSHPHTLQPTTGNSFSYTKTSENPKYSRSHTTSNTEHATTTSTLLHPRSSTQMTLFSKYTARHSSFNLPKK